MTLKKVKVRKLMIDGKPILTSEEIMFVEYGRNDPLTEYEVRQLGDKGKIINFNLGEVSQSWELKLTKAEVAILLLYISWWHVLQTWYGYALWLAPTYVDLRLMLTEMNQKEVQPGLSGKAMRLVDG